MFSFCRKQCFSLILFLSRTTLQSQTSTFLTNWGLKGTYTVSSTTPGYNDTSVLPKELEVTDASEYNLTIAGAGTLTIHVTEQGTPEGTAVVGAKFYRTDNDGNQYGDVVVTDATGNAVFNYVPYAAADAPKIYFKQTESDGEHEFVLTVQETTLTDSTKTLEIANPKAGVKTINLTDANYTGLPISSGTITLS